MKTDKESKTCSLCGYEWWNSEKDCLRCWHIREADSLLFDWIQGVIQEAIFKHVQTAFHPPR